MGLSPRPKRQRGAGTQLAGISAGSFWVRDSAPSEMTHNVIDAAITGPSEQLSTISCDSWNESCVSIQYKCYQPRRRLVDAGWRATRGDMRSIVFAARQKRYMATYIIDCSDLAEEQRPACVLLLKRAADRWAKISETQYAIVSPDPIETVSEVFEKALVDTSGLSITPLRELLLQGDFSFRGLHWQAPTAPISMSDWKPNPRAEEPAYSEREKAEHAGGPPRRGE